mmetsp:Transcript_7795/g.14049  ORF Transcript_7795/g.14049 Transcript_7795/m.14049 type:complete len:213 (+) Transcript_7795:825-1463(+)
MKDAKGGIVHTLCQKLRIHGSFRFTRGNALVEGGDPFEHSTDALFNSIWTDGSTGDTFQKTVKQLHHLVAIWFLTLQEQKVQLDQLLERFVRPGSVHDTIAITASTQSFLLHMDDSLKGFGCFDEIGVARSLGIVIRILQGHIYIIRLLLIIRILKCVLLFLLVVPAIGHFLVRRILVVLVLVFFVVGHDASQAIAVLNYLQSKNVSLVHSN